MTFNVKFVKNGEGITKRDDTLKDEFKKPENVSGIFNWVLDGLKMYYADGHLNPPKCVVEDTEIYLLKSDVIEQFWNECMKQSEGCVTKGKDIYKRFQQWCKTEKVKVSYGRNGFYALLRDRDHPNGGSLMRSITYNKQQLDNAVDGFYVLADD